MRKRELLRLKRLGAKVDKNLDPLIVQSFIDACQCPFCKDGHIYKMLSEHINQIHNVTAYDFREMFGFNRGHNLCSEELVSKRAEISKLQAITNPLDSRPNWRDLSSRYKDGGQRKEAKVLKSKLANTPEAKSRFKAVMLEVDRKVVAAKIPATTRIARAKHANEILWERMPNASQRSEYMKPIRAKMTDGDIKRRAHNMAETMKREYFSNPEWKVKWHNNISLALKRRAKVPQTEHDNIRKLFTEQQLRPDDIAKLYGVSGSRIRQIVHGH